MEKKGDRLFPVGFRFKCLVCDKPILMYFEEGEDGEVFEDIPKENLEKGLIDPLLRRVDSPPYKAVLFSTYGNHGSQVWDCNGMAHGAICDECFAKKSANMVYYEPWTEEDCHLLTEHFKN